MNIATNSIFRSTVISNIHHIWILLIPLIIISAIIVLITIQLNYSAVVESSTFSFSRFLNLNETADGLLVDILWWQAIGKSFTDAVAISLAELLAGMVMLWMIKDSLGLQQLRLTMLVAVWLVPITDSVVVFQYLLEVMKVSLDLQFIQYLTLAWHNGGFIAIVIFLLWPSTLTSMNKTYSVYPVSTFDYSRMVVHNCFRVIVFIFLFRFINHFDPINYWLSIQQNQTNIDYYAPAAASLTLIFEYILLLLLVLNFQKIRL